MTLSKSNIQRTLVHLVAPLVTLIWLIPSVATAGDLCALGQGDECDSSDDCAQNAVATLCAEVAGERSCQIPCMDAGDGRDRARCTLGETCIEAVEPGIGGGDAFICQPSTFSMDLNLLDSCVYHFLEGLAPDLGGSNECSLVQNLSRMLDRDASRSFDIYDVDLCVSAFLDVPACDDKASCDQMGEVYCAQDDECGGGLHCDETLNKCTRHCGFIVDRDGENLLSSLERPCSGSLKICNYNRGECVQSELVGQACQLDRQCPSGAYCHLGECAPKCYRSLDCPSDEWMCSPTNRCVPRPKALGGGADPFVPENYSVQFAANEVMLDDIQDARDVPLLIMNLVTRKQVFDQPNVLFGYRLELEYARKQEDKCLGELPKIEATDSNAEKQAKSDLLDECLIDKDEEFITLGQPFGTLYGATDPSLGVSLNRTKADGLSTGLYQATLTAIFTNGGKTSTTIRYRKPSPSGEYIGGIATFWGGLDGKQVLAGSNLSVRLHVDDSQIKEWDALLAENGLDADKEYVDITEGSFVTGYIHANESAILSWPSAVTKTENEIPVVGIYSAGLGQLRLIGVVDYAKEYCRSDYGKCGVAQDETQVENAFGRRIRRVLEFIGPFDPTTQRYAGTYRETFTGLVPFRLTLDGEFALAQIKQDETPVGLARLPVSGGEPSFPTDTAAAQPLRKLLNEGVTAACAGVDLDGADAYLYQMLQTETGVRNYLANVFDVAPIFENLVTFEKRLSEALEPQGPGEGGGWDKGQALTLMDFLRGQIVFCEPGETGTCIDRSRLECGLALYRRALLASEEDPDLLGVRRGWLDLGAIHGETGLPSCENFGAVAGGQICVSGYSRRSCTGTAGERDADLCESGDICGTYEICRDRVSGAVVPCRPGCGNTTDCPVDDELYYCAKAPIEAPLFCGGVGAESPIPGRSTEACHMKAKDWPEVVALQDHNRFYREFSQTHVYSAADHMSQAFMALFKASNQDPLDKSSAYAHKDYHFAAAVSEYDAVRKDIFGTASSALLFAWPMDVFQTRGGTWMKQMQTIASDRMDALLELIDHRRRVLKSQAQEDYLFAQHVSDQEYLMQVFLLALEKQWEGAEFKYAGNAIEVMDRAGRLLARANENRNPLGLHPNRIYFENADLTQANWQNFYRRLDTELGPLKGDINAAIAEMKGALVDQKTFTKSLTVEAMQLAITLDDLCGKDEPLPQGCEQSKLEKAKLERGCDEGEPNCPFEYTCDSPECDSVERMFEAGTANAATAACRSDTEVPEIKVPAGTRLCGRGRVGALMQEKVSLELQRGQVVRTVENLMRQIARQQQFMTETQEANQALVDYIDRTGQAMADASMGIFVADYLQDVAGVVAGAMECTIGFSTDCVGKAAGSFVRAEAALVHNAVVSGLKQSMEDLQRAKEIQLTKAGQDASLRGMRMELDNLVTQTTNRIMEYEAVTQQLFNIEIQIGDAVFQAEEAAKRFSQQTEDLIKNLTGTESGSILVRNKLVKKANERFQKMLIEAYKMTRAFIHRYNIDDQAEAWTNKVYEIVTVDDLEEFLSFLKETEENYCGAQGLDCDYVHNEELLELSVQKQLFPDLQDIVNPDTGTVLTVGEQFHNIITSGAHLKRRARTYGLSTQIEIPFAIWLNDRGTAGGAPQRYMVGPGDCNHIIRGTPGGGGTLAVNVIGTRIPKSPGVKFELWRGNTDYIRSCVKKRSEAESLINSYIVGWTPANRLGQLDTPPSFVSQSGELPACINNHLLADPASSGGQEGCFHFFARDRSLGAPDYKLVVPYVDGDQGWLLGEGMSEADKPIIEDIVIYFRYNDRPITLEP